MLVIADGSFFVIALVCIDIVELYFQEKVDIN